MTEASDKLWKRQIKVNFIGESGIDAGGLFLEMMTVLFSKTTLMEESRFRLSPALHSGGYRVLGKAVAYALLMGHPGPRRLDPLLSIIHQRTPALHKDRLTVGVATQHIIKQVHNVYEYIYFLYRVNVLCGVN